MNNIVNCNFSECKASLLYLPTFLLLSILAFLGSRNLLSNEAYVNFQKDFFLYFNSELSKYPSTLDNLTQFGDALIILSFVALLLIYAPKVWEALITASIVSAILVGILKPLFGIQRPAAAFGIENLHVIGRVLRGNNSFPSGHSVTVFTVLTVILFAFMPKKTTNQIIWSVSIFSLGIILILTRLGVGAHYPLDVTVGAIVGYISAILGLVINKRYNIWTWIGQKKFYPVFIVIFLSCSIVMFFKILQTNLIVFYFAFLSLLISLFIITLRYVKK
nr:phosphatase PAP2 family protein [uncultured Flavobacterium sp.]